MANTMTAKQLAAWMRENNGNYKPLEAFLTVGPLLFMTAKTQKEH